MTKERDNLRGFVTVQRLEALCYCEERQRRSNLKKIASQKSLAMTHLVGTLPRTELLRGFSLLEVLMAMAILTGVLVGLLSLNIYCMNLQDTAANISAALNQARAKMEEIKGATFGNIIATYNNQDLALTGLNGRMYITASNALKQDDSPEGLLINIRIVAGWAQKAGRIIGEGKLVGGAFVFDDAPPYGNGNGRLDSPVYLQTAIAKKS